MTNKQEKMICNSFGIAKLKAFQKDVITDLLNGKDVLGLARTSEGKSDLLSLDDCYAPQRSVDWYSPDGCIDAGLSAALRGQQNPSGLPVQRQCRRIPILLKD